MTQPAIDRTVFAELQEAAGADFVVDLVETFLDEAPQMLTDLRHAADTGDAETFRRTAHSLKSNSSTFGAAPLAARARELELGGLSLLGGGDAILDALEQEYTRAAQALAELRHA